jgi:hypothetical protein
MSAFMLWYYPACCLRDMNIHLILLAFTYRPISLLMTKKASVLFALTFTRQINFHHKHNPDTDVPHSISIISTIQTLMCPIQFLSLAQSRHWCAPFNFHHKHNPGTDVSHSISVCPDYLGPSDRENTKQSWNWVTSKNFISSHHFEEDITHTNIWLFSIQYRFLSYAF